ncbi:Ycf66 family protein [Oscillatoria sp. CS-180]|uniref:Ycf66 family protein n=1 Tax=Oscillatoria sp. CS-180 TaxID=3021720 RepID=UPI00232ACB4F|nr:Ycf66 family protein [Oscillatoria sp. CS-180]MDB9526170.1 Ycf66 family protein [Oscillatoria sp. CS-180]
MLAYVLAIVIAIGSFSFYMAAFFVPEIHRRQDFFWSGLGLFYAVVLWFCAGRITGAVLLGQTASVALLGWLGWQTLTLRRDLTPETVRTPVTGEDLQRWGQGLQQQLKTYIKVDSLINSIQAVWADVRGAVSSMRNRTAGPRGVDVSSDVPPLKRSPAYEFETAPGEGQSVPSEFATVSARSPQQGTTPIPTEPPSDSSASLETEEVAAPNEGAAPAETVETAAAEVETAETEIVRANRQPAQAAPFKTSKTPQRITATQKSSRPAMRPSQPVTSEPAAQGSKPIPKGTKKVNPVAGVAAWFGDMAKSFRKPKPQRAVIEIPRRAPSIPRSPDAAEAKPSSPPRRPISSQTDASWVDVGDADKKDESTVPPAVPQIDREPPRSPADAIQRTIQPQAAESDSNESEFEQNWPDEASQVGSTPSSTESFDRASATETNWPDEVQNSPPTSTPAPATDDDEESNWPD